MLYKIAWFRNGILKAALYLPDYLRLDGDNPAYEVFLDKRSASSLPTTIWIRSGETPSWTDWNGLDRIMMLFAGLAQKTRIWCNGIFPANGADTPASLDFQRKWGEEQLERRHKRITDPCGQRSCSGAEILPKDWGRWADKVAVRENFIFYQYKRGGAKIGYCTFCGKEVPISGHPYHNKEGRCICCRHPVVFKALGRTGYFQTQRHYAYLYPAV